MADRAMALLGAPFRMHGRSIETGFDCVGVAAACLVDAGYRFDTPTDYRLSGDFDGRAQAFLRAINFRMLMTDHG